MNKALKVLLIISIAAIICGAGIGTAGYLMGGLKNIVITPQGFKTFDENDKNQFEEVNQTFKDVSAININLGAMDHVIIKEGDAFNVSGSCSKLYGGLRAELDSDGKLSVRHSAQDDSVFGKYGTITIGIANISNKTSNSKNYAVVTIPRTTSLSAIDLDLSYGQIAVENVTANRIYISQSSGNIFAGNLASDTLKVESSYGEIETEDINTSDISFDSSQGDISVRNLIASGTITVASSYGDIDLNNVRAYNSRFDLSSGTLTANELFIEDGMTVDNSYGSAILSGNIKGESMINMSSGDVELKLAGAEEDYLFDVDTSFGEIVIGGKNYQSPYSGFFTSDSASAIPNKFTISSDYGEVHVDFSDRQ